MTIITVFYEEFRTIYFSFFINFKLPEKHAASLLLMSLTSMAPYVFTIIFDIKHKIYAIVVAGIAGAFVIVTIATFAKRLWHELKALFNV